MNTHRSFPGLSLHDFVLSFAALSASAGALACSASPDGAVATAPEQTTLDRAAATFDPNQGPSPSCSRIASTGAKGSACLADVTAMCPQEIGACQSDCTCASYVNGCLDEKTADGMVACFGNATSKTAQALTECVKFASPCHAGPDTLAPPYERENEKKLPATLKP